MKLSHLKSSLLAVVFALGVNTTIQSCESSSDSDCERPAGLFHHYRPSGGSHCGGDDRFAASFPDSLGVRRPAKRVSVVEMDVASRGCAKTRQTKPTGCREEPACGPDVFENLKAQILTGCNEFAQRVAQIELYGHLESGHRQQTIWAAQTIACILIETNKPSPNPVPGPVLGTAVEAGKITYKFQLDSCQAAKVFSRLMAGMSAVKQRPSEENSDEEDPSDRKSRGKGSKQIKSGASSSATEPATFADILGYAGVKVGFQTEGSIDVIIDPCHNPCAGLCGEEKPSCGCKKDGAEKMHHDDCHCHGKKSAVNPANAQAINLLIKNLRCYVGCSEVKDIFTKVYDLASSGQKDLIFAMFKPAACR